MRATNRWWTLEYINLTNGALFGVRVNCGDYYTEVYRLHDEDTPALLTWKTRIRRKDRDELAELLKNRGLI